MLLNGVAAASVERAPRELLERVGLADRADHRPDRLSGGEQQRVAIAVALANEPAVLFADEPTGELDTATAHEVFDLLRAVNEELGVTIVVVTHDPLVSEQVSRTIAIRDGRTSTETLRRRALSRSGRPPRDRARSTPSSTASAGCSCRAPTSRRWAWSAASGSRWRPTTSTIWPDRDRRRGFGGAGIERPVATATELCARR